MAANEEKPINSGTIKHLFVWFLLFSTYCGFLLFSKEIIVKICFTQQNICSEYELVFIKCCN